MVDNQSTPQVCRRCQHKNPGEALKCAWCGAPLNTASTTIQIPDLVRRDALSQPRQPTGPASDGLAMYIAGEVQPMMVRGKDEVILGRTSTEGGPSVVIDLTPYNAGMLGVSRRHARIIVADEAYLLEDLGSTNGTWLNEKHLPARTQFVLRNGDQIRLGQLILFVYFAAKGRPGSAENDQTAQTGRG